MARKLTEEKLQAELSRLEQMKEYEYTYAACPFICGIDEAGRGPLAGPVVAGAVILPKDCTILFLNDSKKLSPKKREELYEEIMEKAVATGVGIVDVYKRQVVAFIKGRGIYPKGVNAITSIIDVNNAS